MSQKAREPPPGAFPPPGGTRSTGPLTIVFGVFALVLLLVGGGVGALYFIDKDRANKANADQLAQIGDLRDQLEAAQEELAEVQGELENVRADADDCSAAVQQLFTPAEPGQEPTEEEFSRLVVALIGACDITVPGP